MRPNGKSLPDVAKLSECADLSAADQKKMKRYIEPSKQADMKPRPMMRGSCFRMAKVLLSGFDDVLVALSP